MVIPNVQQPQFAGTPAAGGKGQPKPEGGTATWIFLPTQGKGRSERKPPSQTIDDDFQVDERERHKGVCRSWRNESGFGFIEMEEKGRVPGDSVFVHWKDLKSTDAFPQLLPGIKVELSILKHRDVPSGVMTLKAHTVTAPEGGMLKIQEKAAAALLHFIGGQHARYTGMLRFFTPEQRFGWIKVDEEYAFPEPVPKEIRVDYEEVNAGGQQPIPMKNLPVEFGITRSKVGYRAYNMSNAGGQPLTMAGTEHRKVLEGKSYVGIVQKWDWEKGFGWIKGTQGVVYPPEVVAKIREVKTVKRWGRADGEKKEDLNHYDLHLYFRLEDIHPSLITNGDAQIDKGQQVGFKLYVDDKGAGACDVG